MIAAHFTPSRRKFGALAAASFLAAACGTTEQSDGGGEGETSSGGRKIIGDVLDYALTTPDWTGKFGWVQFRIHEAWFNGQPTYYIRTDASDSEFAKQTGTVFVPKLAEALKASQTGTSDLYVFRQGAAEGQKPIVSAVPGQGNFSPAFRLHEVEWSGPAKTLKAVQEVLNAQQANELKIESAGIVVNYPVVKWPGGELPVDQTREAYLGDGQLLDAPDSEKMTVTFKLHECFPSSRYIVTDTSHAGMAGGMKVGASAQSGQLSAAGATAKIWVFGNGVPGSGPMGGQPSVFDSIALTPEWSPFWDHLTLTWADEGQAKVLDSKQAVEPLLDDKALELFQGTPKTHPDGFVVNCPVPVIAANSFTG